MTTNERPVNLRDAQQPTTVHLSDGRVVDVFPSGTVQIYTADLTRGCEVKLPAATTEGGKVDIVKIG